MLISRPCKKCIVGPICKEACDRIRKRAKVYDNIHTFLSITIPICYLIAFGIIFYNDKRPDPPLGIIVTSLIVYSMISILISMFYIKPQIKKANYKFRENLLTGTAIYVNLRPIKPPPPPKPPAKRYAKGK